MLQLESAGRIKPCVEEMAIRMVGTVLQKDNMVRYIDVLELDTVRGPRRRGLECVECPIIESQFSLQNFIHRPSPRRVSPSAVERCNGVSVMSERRST